MYLINLSQGIPISIWYDWIDDGTDPTDSEDNYGTVTTNYTPKPAYQEMQLLTSNLQGLSYARQLPSASGDYLLAFSSGSQETVAAWTTGSSHSVTVFGQSVTISSTPLYVTANTLTVTAASFTNQYGSPLPPLTVIYSGFVNGDTTNVLSGDEHFLSHHRHPRHIERPRQLLRHLRQRRAYGHSGGLDHHGQQPGQNRGVDQSAVNRQLQRLC
jgi:hypothetical protein